MSGAPAHSLTHTHRHKCARHAHAARRTHSRACTRRRTHACHRLVHAQASECTSSMKEVPPRLSTWSTRPAGKAVVPTSTAHCSTSVASIVPLKYHICILTAPGSQCRKIQPNGHTSLIRFAHVRAPPPTSTTICSAAFCAAAVAGTAEAIAGADLRHISAAIPTVKAVASSESSGAPACHSRPQ